MYFFGSTHSLVHKWIDTVPAAGTSNGFARTGASHAETANSGIESRTFKFEKKRFVMR
jgi:hypothetical protein